ncbi:beta-ketoacyl-ACP synthase [Caulobacter sp. KR2-114]|uniref:beta-ketoacyl-ACP synthase n=1 Tax=Caulobacter sp. KR2-114 TaxID=3400912 RepID=UPI003C1052A6
MTLAACELVVTGLGVVSPLGCGAEAVWRRLLDGVSGVTRLPDDLVASLPAKIGGRVPGRDADTEAGFCAELAGDARSIRRRDRVSLFALAAAREALSMADWSPGAEPERQRTGTVIGTSLGGLRTITEATRVARTSGLGRLSPFTIPTALASQAAGVVSIVHGLQGPISAPANAFAAGAQAIADAARLIRAGEADVVVCGGVEACIDPVSLAGFAAARALAARFNETPHAASRPFDVGHDGFVLAEGAAILVLESATHARARGARVRARLAGYANTADAHHITAPPEDGAGAAQAMRLALARSGIGPAEIGHLNAHATSTPLGDKAEAHAIRSVFGDAGPVVSATKSAKGHLLGAAGALEAIFCILALSDQLAPPILNLQTPITAAAGLNLAGPGATRLATDFAVSNSLGFGGVNTSLVFGRPDR